MTDQEAIDHLKNCLRNADVGTIRSEYRELVSDETCREMEQAVKALKTLEQVRLLVASDEFVDANLVALVKLRKMVKP